MRIATGFFTIEGYDLVRPYLVGKQVRLVVSYDEASKECLRDKLIDDIMLHLSTWGGPNRWAAVLALVEQLQQSGFQVTEQSPADVLEARLCNRDHPKVFIIDCCLDSRPKGVQAEQSVM